VPADLVILALNPKTNSKLYNSLPTGYKYNDLEFDKFNAPKFPL
jgi:hypothetical protein